MMLLPHWWGKGSTQCSSKMLPFFGRLNALNYLWYYLRNINAKKGSLEFPWESLQLRSELQGEIPEAVLCWASGLVVLKDICGLLI